MAGYSLKQLLEWTLEDDVIESYIFKSDERVEIRHSGKIDVYEKQDAEKLLRELVRRINLHRKSN